MSRWLFGGMFGLQGNAGGGGGQNIDNIALTIPKQAPTPAFHVFARSDKFGDLEDVLCRVWIEFAVPFERLDDGGYLVLRQFGNLREGLFKRRQEDNLAIGHLVPGYGGVSTRCCCSGSWRRGLLTMGSLRFFHQLQQARSDQLGALSGQTNFACGLIEVPFQ